MKEIIVKVNKSLEFLFKIEVVFNLVFFILYIDIRFYIYIFFMFMVYL